MLSLSFVRNAEDLKSLQRVLAPDAAIMRRREMEDRLLTAKNFVQVRQSLCSEYLFNLPIVFTRATRAAP